MAVASDGRDLLAAMNCRGNASSRAMFRAMGPPDDAVQATINAVARFRVGACYDSQLADGILRACPLLRLE
ncbi:hypothetical protein DAA51_18200 [Bradyrhizobium sp. WBAH10]|nr:hypothetical protein [Bradyrhizobium sp. WBAH41]MDD1563457.1 hypothetical protein [Bradyrhizobium sp. WBAH33]NRB86515.1 hypothetical protein [Bradyrhizobium sp. WBAH10]QCJ82890.1 hypothetical protein DAA53_18325 [Bradyrhizobium sp. WBAH23]QCJ90252.1 hypothetical protein DAA57_18390 [Bradyrhizobium yuanmingense]